jgi:hypothetical protein
MFCPDALYWEGSSPFRAHNRKSVHIRISDPEHRRMTAYISFGYLCLLTDPEHMRMPADVIFLIVGALIANPEHKRMTADISF